MLCPDYEERKDGKKEEERQMEGKVLGEGEVLEEGGVLGEAGSLGDGGGGGVLGVEEVQEEDGKNMYFLNKISFSKTFSINIQTV